MNKLTIFYLEHCPYCKNARRAVEALRAEDPALEAVDIEWVDERREAARADACDYYYVPSAYLNGEKLYECSPAHGYEDIKAHLKRAMERCR